MASIPFIKPFVWAVPKNGTNPLQYSEVTLDGNTYHYYRERTKLQRILHREDGPAIEYNNGIIEYWIHGKRISSKEEFEKLIKMKAFW